MEWRAYSVEDGESLGCVADGNATETEAQENADSLFGEGKTYVELRNYF